MRHCIALKSAGALMSVRAICWCKYKQQISSAPGHTCQPTQVSSVKQLRHSSLQLVWHTETCHLTHVHVTFCRSSRWTLRIFGTPACQLNTNVASICHLTHVTCYFLQVKPLDLEELGEDRRSRRPRGRWALHSCKVFNFRSACSFVAPPLLVCCRWSAAVCENCCFQAYVGTLLVYPSFFFCAWAQQHGLLMVAAHQKKLCAS